jgi:hypothetical protein
LKHPTAPTRRVALPLLAALACLALTGTAQAQIVKESSGTTKKSKGTPVTVMTRNLYLGADLGPAIASTSTESFIEANGGILRQVDATNFPVRAKGLAKEILEKEPDLVGMQEVALWRSAAPSLGPVFSKMPAATTVKYDFLALLLAQLNKGRTHYLTVIVQPEFDFEAPADANGIPGDGPGGTGLLANLNSDVKTETAIGDGQAYRVLLHAGFRERSTYKPLNCCIEESNFDLTGGNRSEFDHKVDHIMTNAPKAVKLLSSGVTGRSQANGYWDSDHAGLYSVLNILR